MKSIESGKTPPPGIINIGKYGTLRWFIPAMVLLLVMVWIIPGFADSDKKMQTPVKRSIDTWQDTQEKAEKWNVQKAELTILYDKLLLENEALTTTNQNLLKEELKNRNLNKSLERQKLESLRIQKEMLPFLNSVQARLVTLVENDAPFLQKERNTRLKKIKGVMEDIDVSIAEKCRKVMEALAVEAEYGNTIEVYQEKIKLCENEVLGNIFRLGRVSIFFLSLDKRSAARFNVAENLWLVLDEAYIFALEKSMEMAAKRRPMELISLPLGRIAKQ
ncbi:MAG: DUF3450 domain-containing protein [Desulfobacula sp.]|nr:DUF3450 domain-containing protein [Desulfobacula sp.]